MSRGLTVNNNNETSRTHRPVNTGPGVKVTGPYWGHYRASPSFLTAMYYESVYKSVTYISLPGTERSNEVSTRFSPVCIGVDGNQTVGRRVKYRL